MVQKSWFLKCAVVMSAMGCQIIASDDKKVDSRLKFSSLIEKNLLLIGSQSADWRYSFFENIKDQEAVKNRFDGHIKALEEWLNGAPEETNSLKSDNILGKLLRFNEHIFYTVKEVRQSYLPKDAIDPQGTNGSVFYKIKANFVKVNEIEKLIKALQKEYKEINKLPIVKSAGSNGVGGLGKEYRRWLIRTLEGFASEVDRFVDELNAIIKAVGENKVNNQNQQAIAVKRDPNSLTEQWPKKLMQLEPLIAKDTKELLPQFKKIKEAVLALVHFINNKDKMGYNTQEKSSSLNTMLSELKALQKTNFEKKFFFAKKKAIGKQLDELLAEAIKDIETNNR